MKGSLKHVEFIDHLRGIAILGVLFAHTFSVAYSSYDVLPWNGWLREFTGLNSCFWFLPVSFAQAGVPIFFVVSGFCIHMSFQQQGQKWGSFFIRRIFRIYPAYLAALIFFTAIYMDHWKLGFNSRELWKQFLPHVFLVHNCDPLMINAINSPFWSLAVEGQLYLLFPALLLLVAKLGWRRTMIALAGLELLIRSMDSVIYTVGATQSVWCYVSFLLSHSPCGYWFSWSLGAFIADAFINQQTLPFTKGTPAWWVALALIGCYVKPLYSFTFLFFAVITAFVVSHLLNGNRPQTKLPAASIRILKNIGLWSYSLYLIHEPLLSIYFYAINQLVPSEHRPHAAAFLLVMVTWLAIIPFSILWYKLFELPGISLGKRIIRKIESSSDAKVVPERISESNHSWMARAKYGLMIGGLLCVAAGSFVASAKFTPPEPAENNNLAWTLATSPDPAKRNGILAVELAEDACQRTRYQVTVMVGTLAAAYAEAGRFDDAVVTAQRACSLAEENGETNLFYKNEELLGLYIDHQPYRDSQVNISK